MSPYYYFFARVAVWGSLFGRGGGSLSLLPPVSTLCYAVLSDLLSHRKIQTSFCGEMAGKRGVGGGSAPAHGCVQFSLFMFSVRHSQYALLRYEVLAYRCLLHLAIHSHREYIQACRRFIRVGFFLAGTYVIFCVFFLLVFVFALIFMIAFVVVFAFVPSLSSS